MTSSTHSTQTPSGAVDIDVVAAVHHPTRRRILELLSVNGPATVGVIADGLGLQIGSISHHVKTLEKAGLVAPAPDLARDRRESWWRAVPRPLRWSLADYADSPTAALVATAAEHDNLRHHTNKVLDWFASREEYGDAWVRAAFSTDTFVAATPRELAELGERIGAVIATWTAEVNAASGQDDPAAERLPIFVFAHANPAKP